MKNNNILKKGISALLMGAMLISHIPALAMTAEEEAALLFKEDYQGVALGGSPTYGATNWSGDTSASHGECTIGVVDENGNRSFRMQYVGEGKSVTADPLVYRNMTVQKGETHVFKIRMKTDDTNQTKSLFIRTANAEKIDLFGFSGAKVLTVGSATGNLKKGKWYDVKVVIDGTKKIADVYVDGIYGGSRFLTKYDMTAISMRVTMMGATAKGVKTNIYIDNVAYADKNVNVTFEEPEFIEEVPPAEEGVELAPITNENISVLCIDNTKAYLLGEFKDTGLKTTVYRGNTIIPLRNVAEACGATLFWNGELDCAQLNIDGRNVNVANDYIEIDGEKQDVVIKPVNLGGRLYLDIDSTKLVTGKTVVADLSGSVAIYSEKPNDGEVSTILDRIAFTEPSAEEILADFESFNSKNAHPRVLIDGKRLDKVKSYIKNDETFAKWYETVVVSADRALKAPISKYELRDGERLLYVSREAHDNIIYPAFVYLIGGEKKYLERAVAEMLAVSEFSDWHPEHFLDTAEMALAVAIGYDWLYSSLTKKQKETIRTALLRLGLDAANEAYEGTAEYSTKPTLVNFLI